MKKVIQFKIKGMQRDLSVSSFSPEYAYENKNIRIMSTDDNTLLSIINEKGNKYIPLKINDSDVFIEGIPVGQAVIDNTLVLFTCGTGSPKKDKIYKIWFEGNTLKGEVLVDMDLNFKEDHPIETLTFYENEGIKKVYWTDGLNSPRVINIEGITQNENKNSFDFVSTLNLEEKVTITRNTNSNGIFAPGTIQYAFTYFNKYGQESNIFYTSPLYYTSYEDRGASPEDKLSNSFDIEVTNLDGSFTSVRVYSIHRSSENAAPEVKIVTDLNVVNKYTSEYNVRFYETAGDEDASIYHRTNNTSLFLSSLTPAEEGLYILDTNEYKSILFDNNVRVKFPKYELAYVRITKSGGDSRISVELSTKNNMTIVDTYNPIANTIKYTDTGTSGSYIDPTELLYVGGEDIIAGTIAQKDNTLFLGDIEVRKRQIDENVKLFFKETENINFEANKEVIIQEPDGNYPYKNQLDSNSNKIKSFKYLEYYRLGIQFQHKTGKWSEPIWLNDVKNTIPITTNIYTQNKEDYKKLYLPTAKYTLNTKNINIQNLIKQDYIKVRPVIVYPSINDRESICQGVLCPTVYNVKDRFENAPFAQSSWFIRPNAPYDIKTYENNDNAWVSFDGATNPSKYSKRGVITNEKTTVGNISIDSINMGAWTEFRHNFPIPSNNQQNAEIQNIYLPPGNPFIPIDTYDVDTWVKENREYFFVDQSILTLHSPDIEFDTTLHSLDLSDAKLRIVGVVPLTSFSSDIDIQTSTPVNSFKNDSPSTSPIGFYKENIEVLNSLMRDGETKYDSRFGWRGLTSGAFWFDEISSYKSDKSNGGEYTTGFVVYPWHRNGSLNNTKNVDSNNYKSALLDKKKMSNLKFSYNNYYLPNNEVWKAFKYNDADSTGISDVKIFNSNEITNIRIKAPKNSTLEDINYYGNIDILSTLDNNGKYTEQDKKSDGYPIMTSGRLQVNGNDILKHLLFTGNYTQVDSNITNDTKGVDQVRIKYKSTPHAVLALNYTSGGSQRTLPLLSNLNSVDNKAEEPSSSQIPFWGKGYTGIYQEGVKPTGLTSGYILYGWLWLGELYRDNVSNRFGGTTEEAFANNQWLPCGEAVSLDSDNVTITWTEGDTYYQRYDHIKTYPFTLEDQNSITEIVSFMCETRVNIDGRYDRNRGLKSNLSITPNNFNLLNSAYSQQNNFFNYRGTDSNKLNTTNFKNLITWTKTKNVGELVDTWTNITLASTLDLDGDKGQVRAIRRFNNNLIAFQDRGISQILYNENVQLSTTEGVPVEIGNSGKVTGKRYISDSVGCSNKWSICETPSGIYFIDDITKGIYLFNGQLNNISKKFGFNSWINKVSKLSEWNPSSFDNIITYYDTKNGDVLFINKDECLAFSEPLGQFSSFYSYEGTPYLCTLKDKVIAINKGVVEDNDDVDSYKLWEHNGGDYNYYFGEYEPFYTTVIANPESTKDKIFSNIEFRSDSWDEYNNLTSSTFDNLNTWNEYQNGSASLINNKDIPSSLKRKFRIWRANIPRDKFNGRDRMRNPWLYLKLSKESENKNKTILHDIVVHYFD